MAMRSMPMPRRSPRSARSGRRPQAARDTLGIDVGEDRGVDHAAAEDLDVAGAFAQATAGSGAEHAGDIDLGAGLGEGKNEGRRRMSTRIKKRRAKYRACPRVSEADALIDDQPLDLVEHRRVRRVVVFAIHLARRDDAHRRLLRQHGADLDRRGVRAQDQPPTRGTGQRQGLHIERVLHIALGDRRAWPALGWQNSLSTCGPLSTTKPISAKIASSSRRTCDKDAGHPAACGGRAA